MGEKKLILLPKISRMLVLVGENIKLAPLRRKLSSALVAERAGITRTTLWQIEKGSGGVFIAAYAGVLLALNLEKDILKLAADDSLGRNIQDTDLLKKRQKKHPKASNADSTPIRPK